MKTEFLNNRGINLFKDELETKMLSSDSFNIASAFVTYEGIELIKLFLHKNKNRKGIGRLITGFYNCFNSQEVLMDLQSLAKNSKGRLLVNISTNERFHWKYYHFESNPVETAYIGSANFTGAGMSSEGEIISKLSLIGKDKSERQNLKKIFNTEFENSIDIIKFPLEDYRQSKSATSNSTGLPPSIRKILKTKPKIQAKGIKINTIRAILVTGNLSYTTVKIIKEKKSNWDSLEYISCGNKAEYDAALKTDRLFLISRYNRKYSFDLVEIKDSCQLKTPDGEYFILYKKTIKTKHTENIKWKTEIEQLGIFYHKRVQFFKQKTLRQKQTIKLLSLFGIDQ